MSVDVLAAGMGASGAIEVKKCWSVTNPGRTDDKGEDWNSDVDFTIYLCWERCEWINAKKTFFFW